MARQLMRTTLCAALGALALAAAPTWAAVIAARPGDVAPLTLAACVERAVAHNDAVRVEKLRRRELEGRMTQALSTGLPTLEANTVWNRGRDPSFALDSTFGGGGEAESTGDETIDALLQSFDFIPNPEDIPAQTYWRTSLDANWTINPTRIKAARDGAGLSLRGQELAIEDAVQAAELATVVAFHNIVLAAEEIAAVEAQLANQREFLDIMRLRQQLELATALDTLQAAVAVGNLQPQLRLARRALQTAGAELNAAMGVDPEAPVAIVGEQKLEPERVVGDSAVALAERRLDLEQLDIQAKLLEQTRRSQTADLRPYLSLNGSYGLVGKEIGELGDRGHNFWNASVALNIPLFNGMDTRGQLRESKAAIQRTRSEREGLARQARVQVLDLLAGLDVARRNLRAAELNMVQAEELLDTSKLMLRHGQVEYLTVLESEAERVRARTNLIQARFDVLTTTASLKRAIGVSPMRALASVPGLTAEDN